MWLSKLFEVSWNRSLKGISGLIQSEIQFLRFRSTLLIVGILKYRKTSPELCYEDRQDVLAISTARAWRSQSL
jgi:hypothetical protein